MSSAGASVSEMWRKEGNQHYVSVRDSLTPDLRRQRLLSALKCYYKANDFSNTAVERSSAAKNTGMAAWKLAVVLRICNERFSLQQHYFKEAIQHFNLGITSGEPVQSEDWVKKVTGMLFSCTQEALQNCGNLETDQRVQAIEEYLNYLSPDHPSPRTDCFIEIANVLFRAGITSLQIGNYKDCLQRMHQCYQPIEEGKRSARDGIDLLQELQILENDVFIHTCVSESIQARTTGDEILQGILLNEEDLNISMIWEVVDWYRRAVLLTRELEVEMEAIALSRIGKVFDKVLKMKVKAKESYMRCIHLALSMYPRTFSDQDWYQEANQTLEQYQQEVQQQEDYLWQKERAETLKELTAEIKQLDQKENEYHTSFLQFVYKTFPPKNPKFGLSEEAKKENAYLESSKVKKLLQQAVVHYHPDRQKQYNDKKWLVLSEEITKRLTKRYEQTK